jgi:hypothetical protein
MFGAVDCTGAHTSSEAATDCSDALEGMWAFVKYMSETRGISLTMDLSACLGLGISRSWVVDTGLAPGLHVVNIFRIRAGRLIAMAAMTDMVKLKGEGFEVDGLWELYGNTYSNVALGYGYGLTKHGLTVEDSGGSSVGNLMAVACRRFGLNFSSLGGTNNIPITVGTVKAVRCGNWGSTGALKFNGTYASGSWTNNPGDTDSSAQVHRMTLTPTAGTTPTDLEVGDLIWFNSATPGVVRNIASSTGTTITIDVFPWQSAEASGTFRSMHGGGVDFKGANLANCNVGLIEAFVCGTGIRVGSQYCPTIKSLLCEVVGTAAQIGGVVSMGESLEGLNVQHFHFENDIYSMIDVQAAAEAAWFGIPSNMEGSTRGKLDKCLRLNPARVFAGVWTAPVRTSLNGIGFRFNGGSVESPRAVNVEYNLSGGNNAIIGNSPTYQCGPCYADSFDFYLIAERSIAEQISNRTSRMVEWGPIYGSGTHGAPTGNVVFQIWSGDLLGGSTTVDGGATKTLTSADGALQGVAVYESPASGNNGNWKIFSWKATGA